ncbi:hypothetical protein MHTCC0001_31310 [Flavobacteriaceae bacterium MHTCC 0001]
MKKVLKFLGFTLLFGGICFAIYTVFMSLVIQNPNEESACITNVTIAKIAEGTSFDVIFTDVKGDHYYINRALERGLNLDSLNAKVLNKTVTLHLAKILGGFATSEHISQLSVDNTIIFTEFE